MKLRRWLAGAAVGVLLGFGLNQTLWAQSEVDAKIKALQDLEARIDAKIKRLDSLEARLEARLDGPPQLMTASTTSAGYVNGASVAALPIAGAAAAAAGAPRDQLWGGQVSFRGGYTHLSSPARSAVFTGNETGQNGYMVGAALDVPLIKEPWFNNTLLGQISMDFSGISGRTTFAVSGERGKQSLYKIAVSPKYRFDTLGNFRPWIIPIGLSFLVSSPPSNSVSYLTVGGTTGGGLEYVLLNRIALGLAASYNFYSEDRNRISTDHFTVGPYLGINF